MADDNAFTNLRNDGAKGVYFDSGAAQTMAQQAADMLTVVNAALALVQQEKDLPPFNQRTSGKMLADKFNAAMKRLGGTVATDHQEVLTSMGEAFVAANKEYADADQTSAVNFDHNVGARFSGMHASTGQPGLATSSLAALTQHVDSVSLPGWGQSRRGNVYGWSGTSKDDYSDKLNAADGHVGTSEATNLSSLAHGAGISLDGKAITPEPGSQYGWDDFHNHWQYIHDSTILGDLAKSAQDWKTAAAYIKSQAETFTTTKDQYLTGYQGDTSVGDKVWASDAAKQARDGIGRYLANVKTLTDSMELMSANLAVAEGWLKKLQNFLPYQKLADTTEIITGGESAVVMPISQASVDEAMAEMRQAWDEWYGNGVKDSSGAVPIIPDPKAAVVVTPPQQQQQDQQQQQPSGGPNGSPAGSPTGTPQTQTPNLDANPTQPTDPNNPTTDKNPTNTDTTQQTLQTLITQAGTVLQSGITALEQGVEKVASAVEQGLQTTQTTAKTTEPTDLQNQLTQQLQDMGLTPNANTPGGTPSGGSPSTPTGLGSPQTPKTQLSPRSSTPEATTETESETTTTSRAGLASSSSSSSSTGSTGGMGGSPMAAGSQQGQGKEHKRPQFLTNLENFEEVLGEVPAAVTPVAEK
ncbi:hypothetical protein [Nocardia yunnanensis]|nr:hypothetical protein [Nocardia yunnanensis]